MIEKDWVFSAGIEERTVLRGDLSHRRSQPCQDKGTGIPGRGHSQCKGPQWEEAQKPVGQKHSGGPGGD